MVRREHLQNRQGYGLLCCCLLLIAAGCRQKKNTADTAAPKDFTIDTSGIPKDTVLQGDKTLSVVNGVYHLGQTVFSGIIKELYPTGRTRSYKSISKGVLHGTYRSFYEDGSRFEVRSYRNNLATGRHYGYWPGGVNLKFDYRYYEEKKEGPQKKWYKNGSPYLFTAYTNDREDGLQQGWRENGKLFINYVAKDGYTYGLQQTALCYTLLNEELKIQAGKQ